MRGRHGGHAGGSSAAAASVGRGAAHGTTNTAGTRSSGLEVVVAHRPNEVTRQAVAEMNVPGFSAGAADVSAGLLSSDGEPLGQIAGGSSEFDRLMEDSVESDHLMPGYAFVAPAAALMRSPRASSDVRASPQVSPLRGSPFPRLEDPLPAAAVPSSLAFGRSAPDPPGSERSGSSASTSGPQAPQDSWAMKTLSGRIDHLAREMKLSVEHEFGLAEQAIITQQRAVLEAQKLKADAHACQQQALIESLQEEKVQLSRRVELNKRQLKESLSLLSRARNGVVGRCALERVMCSWRAKAALEKTSHRSQFLAGKLHVQRLATTAFSAWRCQAHATVKSKLVAHERAAADMVRAQLFEQMELDRSRSAAEVERLSRLLAEESQQRQLLQENLKRVFMRGVCALNFEAMTLLSDGTSAAEPAGPVLAPPPPAPDFDWAEFEANAAGGASIHPEPEPTLAAMPSEIPVAVAAARADTERFSPAAPERSAQANSPRQPPVPSPQPMAATAVASPSLPFVNWRNPPEPSPSVAASRVSLGRSSLKSQRWQSANVPRAPGQLRPEVIAVG